MEFKTGDTVVLKGEKPLAFGYGKVVDPVLDHLGEIGILWEKISYHPHLGDEPMVCGQRPDDVELSARK